MSAKTTALQAVLLVLLTLVALKSAMAQQPAGVAPCGVPVFVFQTGMGGMSTYYNGQPIVVLDPQVAAGDPNFRTFTLWHECGHHVNGDTLPQGMAARWFMSAQQEMMADCYAAQNVPQGLSQAVAQYFSMSQGNYSPAPGYPTGNMRAQNIMRCAGINAAPTPPSSQGCPGLSPGMSLTCRYTSGPLAGQVQNFCGVPGARPAPIGGFCGDGRGNIGVAQ